MQSFSPKHQQFRDAHKTPHALERIFEHVTEPGVGSRLAKPLTLAAMSLGYGLVQLDVTIVNTALNSIGASLGGGVSELQWIVSTYTIAFAAFILTAGALGDRLGAKKIFIAGFAIFTTASLGCALWRRAQRSSSRRAPRRAWVPPSWCRTRLLCSLTLIRTRKSAGERSACGRQARALRSPPGRSPAVL
jgi:MFS transporter